MYVLDTSILIKMKPFFIAGLRTLINESRCDTDRTMESTKMRIGIGPRSRTGFNTANDHQRTLWHWFNSFDNDPPCGFWQKFDNNNKEQSNCMSWSPTLSPSTKPEEYACIYCVFFLKYHFLIMPFLEQLGLLVPSCSPVKCKWMHWFGNKPCHHFCSW